jgi:AcrR family transcriptional regulator
MDIDWSVIQPHILDMEQRGLVTRTFRRLDPDRQQAVLAAILEEAIARGPTAINITQVAARAQVSVGSLYQYFGNRAGLLAFVVELVTQLTTDFIRAVSPYLQSLPVREALTAYLQGSLEWSQTQPAFVQFYTRAAYHGDSELSENVVRPIATVLRQSVHDILARAEQRGELRPGLDLEAAARVIYALTMFIVDPILLPYLNIYLQVTDADMSPERVIAAAVELILKGIGA